MTLREVGAGRLCDDESIKEWSGSWGQHGFWKTLKTDGTTGQIVAKVALVKDYAFESITQPAMVERATGK